MRFDLDTLDSGERSLPFGLLVCGFWWRWRQRRHNNIGCGYSLESPCQGDSDEYSQPMLLWRNMSCLTTKPTKWHVRPAKTQISLGIRPVWSESWLSPWRKLGSSATHWAHSRDSDQTGWTPRLIWVFTGCTCHFVGFIVRRLIWKISPCLWFQKWRRFWWRWW